MAEGDGIRYSDIIQPDDAINQLINQLSELNRSYAETVSAIQAGANKISSSLSKASIATKAGKDAIDVAALTANRLERAYIELGVAMSDTGKEIARLRTLTSDVNKSNAEQLRYMSTAVTSYNRLNKDLKEAVSLYKSLTEAERADAQMGGELLDTIINLKNQVKALDDQMKPHIQRLTETQKAEQRLAFLRSEEGQNLLRLRERISQVTSEHKKEAAAVNAVAEARRKLAYAQSEENEQLKSLQAQTREANRIAELQAQLNSSAEGSYNRLAAQYALNKIELNAMSAAERQAADSGQVLERQTREIYARMIQMQEATGYHALSVGNYQKAWNGLGFSIAQVVRELPAATVSLNTFFLAISNNIPMVVDEIRQLRYQNSLLRKEGQATISIGKEIVRSLLSWNTALVIILTVLSAFGKEIIEWTRNLFNARRELMSFEEAMRNVRENMEDNNAGFGDNVVLFKNLQEEYKKLSTEAQKLEWIKNLSSEFSNLGVAINSVNDADNYFIDNSAAVIESLKQRALIASAQNLAAEKYNEALLKEQELLNIEDFGDAKSERQARSAATTIVQGQAYFDEEVYNRILKEQTNKRKEALRKAADDLYAEAEQYYNIAHGRLDAINKKGGGGLTVNFDGNRDPWEYILRTQLAVRKKYEESQTKLILDELDKRERAAYAAYNAETGELMNTYAKNKRILEDTENLYRDLKPGEREVLEKIQDQILEVIISKQKELNKELDDIERERQLRQLRLVRQNLEKRLEIVKKGSTEEMNIRLAMNRVDRDIELTENAALPKSEQLSPEDIMRGYDVKGRQIKKDTELQRLNDEQDRVNLELQMLVEGSQEELQTRLKLSAIQEQIALLENEEVPGGARQDPALITAGYARSRNLLVGQRLYSMYEQILSAEESFYNVYNRTARQETLKALETEEKLIQQRVALWLNGMLELSDAEIISIQNRLNEINAEKGKVTGFTGAMGSIAENGMIGSIFDYMGYNQDYIDAFNNITDQIISNLRDIAAAYVEVAEAAVEAAEARVEAAQEALDVELEARANGYANSVATMQAELQAEKRNQMEKQKLLEQAQRSQEAINSAVQASSLVTATAQLLSSFSGIPIVGQALAIAAIATMWATFAAAKIKAAQVTKVQSQAYGEGGYEVLQGGSHASGNDIDLGVTNRRGRRMRAEGGEAMAIINKRQTARYRKVLPDVINSINKGVFEEKYMKAFDTPGKYAVVVNTKSDTDLSRVEGDLRTIRRQGETRYTTMPDGTTVIQYKNVKRIIKSK